MRESHCLALAVCVSSATTPCWTFSSTIVPHTARRLWIQWPLRSTVSTASSFRGIHTSQDTFPWLDTASVRNCAFQNRITVLVWWHNYNQYLRTVHCFMFKVFFNNVYCFIQAHWSCLISWPIKRQVQMPQLMRFAPVLLLLTETNWNKA